MVGNREYVRDGGINAQGRYNGRRRRRSIEEKRRIVEETLQPGASVRLVARRHELSANVLFVWRRRYLNGELGAVVTSSDLISVNVVEPEPEATSSNSSSRKPCTGDVIELKTAEGVQLRVTGRYLAREALREIIARVLPR